MPPRVYNNTEPWGAHWQESLCPSTEQVPCPSAAEMDEDKQNPQSRSPSPWPSWMEDESLSGQWEGAVGGSDLPLSETEEGAFLDVDEDWKYDTNQELSQWGDVKKWQEDVTLQELSQWEEMRVPKHSQWGAETHPDVYKFEEDVRVQELPQCHDGSHPEVHQWEENMREQELYQLQGNVRAQVQYQWEENGVTYQVLAQWNVYVEVDDLPLWEEEETYQELSQWGEDVRGQDLNLRGDQGARELSPLEEEFRGQELAQDDIDQELPQMETKVSQKGLSQWGDNVDDNTWDKPFAPVTVGDPKSYPQEGPSSPSTVGTEGAGQAALDLPSVAPAPLSPTDTEPAAAAPAGAAEEEEPQGPLITEEAKAEGSPTFGEQVPPAGTESNAPAPHSPSEASQALMGTDQDTSREIPSQAELEIQGSVQQPEEEHDLEETMTAEMEAEVTGEKEESPGPAPQSPCSPSSPSPPQVISQVLSEKEKDEEAEGESVFLVQEMEEEALAGEERDWKYNVDQESSQREDEEAQELTQEEINTDQGVSQGEDKLLPGQVKGYQLSDWEEHIEEQQSQEGKRYKEPPRWEDFIKEEFSPGQVSSDQTLPSWEDSSMEELSQGKFSSYQELLSNWEDSIAQELSLDDDSIGQEFSDWEDYGSSMPSRWEDDSDRGLTREDWEYMTVHTIEVKPLRPEEDEWEELSVLELSQGEGREERLRIFGAEGLPVPAPREAWAERRAPAPSTAVPLCACPAPLDAQSPRGAAASPALAEQGAGAGTGSQGPAPQSPCRPLSPSQSQVALPKKRPSRARRALRALRRLFRSCLGAQPED